MGPKSARLGRWVTHPSHKLVPCETPGIWHLLARYGAIIVPEPGTVRRRVRVSREIGRGIHQFYPRRRREHRAQVADRSQKNQISKSHLRRCRDCVGLKVRGCQKKKKKLLEPAYLEIHDIPPTQSPNILGAAPGIVVSCWGRVALCMGIDVAILFSGRALDFSRLDLYRNSNLPFLLAVEGVLPDGALWAQGEGSVR